MVMWKIDSLGTTSGYLKACPIKFTEGLNCIIGARGTCKSTIVETIRFVFDCDPDAVRVLTSSSSASGSASGPPRTGLISETLDGGTANCSIEGRSGQTNKALVVERTLGQSPRLFRDGVQLVESADDLHRIEIYSQGDLQALAEKPSLRLALVDRPNQARIKELNDAQQAIGLLLKELGERLRKRRAEIETREAKLQNLSQHREHLKCLIESRPTLPAELERERGAYENRKRTFQNLRDLVELRNRMLQTFPTATAGLQELSDSLKLIEPMEGAEVARIRADLSALVSLCDQVNHHVRDCEDLSPTLSKIEALHHSQDAKYLELMKEQQVADHSLRQEEALTEEITALELIERELRKLLVDDEADQHSRRDSRAERNRLRDEIYDLRMEEVESINSLYNEQIVLTLAPGTLSAQHHALIKELLGGSNMRNQDEIAIALAQNVEPTAIVDIVERGDAPRLSSLLQRDLGQMTRLVGHFIDHPLLYQLEKLVPEDTLEITMVVRGESRPINQLSKGQMATALLPLILREAEYPLLVDQPEDDLDNAFVSEKLIDRVQELSRSRQLIFVTHNANIPVLGDASNVIVMEMDGPRSALPCRYGTVDQMKDDVIKILEGGKQAFCDRQARYGL